MSTKQFKLMASAELTKLIGSIGKAKVKLDAMIQIAAVQAVAYSIVDRNATPATQLYEALRDGGIRGNSLVAFFEKFGNLAYSREQKKVLFFDTGKITGKDALKWTDEYAAKVAETLWHKVIKQPEPKSVYDAQEEVEKLLDRLTKLATKPGTTMKHKDLLDGVQAALGAYYMKQTKAAESADLIPDDQKKAVTPTLGVQGEVARTGTEG